MGVITGNGNSIKCGWSPPPSKNSNVANLVLVGSLSYSPGYFVDDPQAGRFPIIGFVPPMATLDGTVTAYDVNSNVIPNMGPGDVSGSAEGWHFV
jgi:hypothetical protein